MMSACEAFGSEASLSLRCWVDGAEGQLYMWGFRVGGWGLRADNIMSNWAIFHLYNRNTSHNEPKQSAQDIGEKRDRTN